MPKCPISGPEDWSVWYSPGVAAPCKAIVEHPDHVYNYTK
jgi:malate dehydrogenase (oxaloacetate-decarboxylating)